MLDQIDHDSVAMHAVLSPYRAFRPPKRKLVSESATGSLVLKDTGGPATPWDASDTPYMVEPMNTLASRRHEAVCFVGPARTGKTAALLLGWMTHAIVTDPGDMLMVNMTQDKAREFSKTDVDRALRYSPDIAALKSTNHKEDNTHDKQFKHGMWLRIAWPTAANLSGSTYRYVAITDLDRMANAEDVDGEGPVFDLGRKRTTTFMSRGMTLVESSPGRDIEDPHWKPANPHEAPPTTGVLGIYNTSDRRRWYWKCPDCRDWFEAAPGLKLFNLPPTEQLLSMVREADLTALADDYNRVICPHCGSMISPKLKSQMNRGGIWLPEGARITSDDEIQGQPVSSPIAGYWLGGVTSFKQSWKSLLMRHFAGLRHYALTGDDGKLKATVNTDQGAPYLSMRLLEAAGASDDPRNRKDDAFVRFVAPPWTRFLIATVDVQGGSSPYFDVQVQAVGPQREKVVIDRKQVREITDKDGVVTRVDPASVPEHWDALTDQVLRSTYRTEDEGREVQVLLLVCDTGGEKGRAPGATDEKMNVTHNAYAWYRRLRRERLHGRVMLVKGHNTGLSGSPIKETWVGNRSGREKGDVPIYLLDTNRLKDIVDSGVRRTEPGPGYLHIASWLPKSWFDELQAEVRDPKTGKWVQVRKRNETLDHLQYCEAGYLRLGADRILDWDNAPKWAQPLTTNEHVISTEDRREMQEDERLAAAPAQQAVGRSAQQPTAIRQRRMARSGYVRR